MEVVKLQLHFLLFFPHTFRDVHRSVAQCSTREVFHAIMSTVLALWGNLEDNLTKKFDTLLELSVAERDKWFDQCDRAVKLINEGLTCNVSVHVKQSLTARLGRLESLIVVARYLQPVGGAIGVSTRRLEWRDLHTVFRRRIRTGVVANLTHIDPKFFLNDAKAVVLREITAAITEHRCVKVNTCLNAKFLLRDIKEVKSFNTVNIQLFANNDLGEWYDVHVSRSILTQLGEFQERDSG